MCWRNIGPLRGGRGVAVAGVASDPRTYYFGSAGGGVYKTTNDGISWTNVTDGYVKTSSVGAIAVAPSDPNVVYVGMGEYAVRDQTTSYGDGVYRSTDGGKSWKHLGLQDTRVISRIVVHPSNPDLAFIAAQGTAYVPSKDRGVYRTRDGGATWQKVLYVDETTGPADLMMDPTNPRILYAAMWDHQRKPWYLRSGGPGSGLYKSTDGGDHWEKMTLGLPDVMGRIGIAISANPSRVYALVECQPKGGLYRSEDGGKTWALINESRTLISRAWYYTHFVADPKDPNVVWVFNTQIYRSIDAGRSFTLVEGPHGDFHDAWINPSDPNNLIIATDGGGTITHDGGLSWSSMDNQATGQFYRVITDDRFPYWVYGAQQDGTTVAIASASHQFGIGWKDWYQVGGCESGWVALDRRNPRWIYAGCQGGQITEFDPAVKDVHNIMAYPLQEGALELKDRRYRFNWNAPIIASRHDGALYHAAQKLLRSEDRGIHWREISPDLTQPTPATLRAGQGPFQHEDQIYHSITYVAESPHDRNVIWTGSDDGVVALTRDGGSTWKRFSLPGLLDALINAIEVSPHDPATAYVAATRYKFNDFKPYFFRTTNFGGSWQEISSGIPLESRSHVIREDPVQKGLLYAGTETGVFVSFDAGAHWQSLQLNLPVTPVTDLEVHDTDLVASTQGRAFWILDDLSPLRQMDSKLINAAAHLFRPRVSYRSNIGWNDLLLTDSPYIYRPQATNAPGGAVINFYVAQGGPVSLEIRDAPGRRVRLYSTESGSADLVPSLKVQPGMNRITWDLRHDPVGVRGIGSAPGRLVRPGRYEVRLTAAGTSLSVPLEVRQDPRFNSTEEGLSEQDQMLADLDEGLRELYRSVSQIRDLRGQIESLMNKTASSAVQEGAKRVLTKLDQLEGGLMSRPGGGPLDVTGTQPLVTRYLFLRSAMGRVTPTVTQGHRQAYAEVARHWADYKQRLSAVFDTDVGALNRLAEAEKVPAISLPR